MGSPDLKARRFSWNWLRERFFPRGARLVTWTAYVIVVFVTIDYILSAPDKASPRFFATILALSLLLIFNITWSDLSPLFPSEFAGDLSLLLASTALTFFATWTGQLYNSIYIVFMLASEANIMLRRWPAMLYTVLLAASWIGLVMVRERAGLDSLTSLVMGMVIGLVFVITLTQALNAYSRQTVRANQLLQQLQATNAELLQARQKEKELAVAEERLRVARDLHDGLGHHLTALSIQLQAVEKLMKTNPELAAEAARNSRSEVQAALKEVRQSVATLRSAPLDLQELPRAIEGLVSEVGRVAGLEASFVQQGEPVPLAPAAAMTLYRAAQESLTNVQKHALDASRVEVRLVYAAEEACLSVQDDGQDRPCCEEDEVPEGGFGLAGLQERANLLGGRLEYGPVEGQGFRLALSLPLNQTDGKGEAG